MLKHGVSTQFSDDELVVKLDIGYFRTKIRPTGRYYYWQYYLKSGKKFDKYLGTDRSNAIATAKKIGIPCDASCKRRKKQKS